MAPSLPYRGAPRDGADAPEHNGILRRGPGRVRPRSRNCEPSRTRRDVVAVLMAEVVGPIVHQPPPLQQVGTRVGCLDPVLQDVCKRGRNDLPRVVGLLGRVPLPALSDPDYADGRLPRPRGLGAGQRLDPPMRRGTADVSAQKVYRIAKLTPRNEIAPSLLVRKVTGSLPSSRSCESWLRRRSHAMSSAVNRPKCTQRTLTPRETAPETA